MDNMKLTGIEQPQDLQSKHKDHYTIFGACTNCGYTGRVEIPSGKEVNEAPCPNCNVKAVERYPQMTIKARKGM